MENEQNKWWKNPLRVIQTNLQVKDTDKINPEELAQQMEDMNSNVLVFNVGGIYAWYDTQLTYHNKNEFLPENFDLLEEVISACHKRGIKFIARFDFSKADDYIYQNHPEWFVRDQKGNPQIIGAERPGKWSLLYSACINSGYRNKDLAVPAIDEVISNYDIDGIFYNAPGFIPCYCDECQRKYQELYNEEMPADSNDFNPDWSSTCLKDNIDTLYQFIKNKDKDIQVVLYYGLHDENFAFRGEIADMVCTEAQDVLSLGRNEIPEFWKPSLIMKMGRNLPDTPDPFGIIHSSPGMDWRHTGLPPAEYLFWLTQIPANGGYIWHSLTGVPETITDKRILNIVTEMNGMTKKVESHMHNAESLSQVVMLWQQQKSAEGWADGLISNQIPFDILSSEFVDLEHIKNYRVVVIPENWKFTSKFVLDLKEYVKQGGNVIVEGNIPHKFNSLSEILGIEKDTYRSEYLKASYLRFEGDSNLLQKGMEETELIAHRGEVSYCIRRKDAEVLATLVPPFSPLESVGRPPERASMNVSHTEIPLAILNQSGDGKVLYLPFSLSMLIDTFKLTEHYQLINNAINILLGEYKLIETSHYQGLNVTVFRKENEIIVNFVNGTGRRPLSENIPLYNIETKIRLDNETVKNIKQLIVDKNLDFEQNDDEVNFNISELRVWESILIELK